ncbi:bile acid:sodium symporter family protein [Insolitispirillum peregrinum]|uniref:hypothetical protein n=1 Tax=Insolitispirillum peregrinum TaxID=80876 RepID=UPI003619FEF4
MGNRLISLLARRSRLILALSLGVGLAVPPLAAALKPLLAPGVIGLLWAAMVRLDVSDLRRHVRHPRRLLVSLALMMGGVPLVMWGIGQGLDHLFVIPGGITAALVLMAASPTLTSAPALAALLRLDSALALLLLLGGTALVSFSAPLMMLALTPVPLGDLWTADGLAVRLLVLIAGTTLVAALSRRGMACLSHGARAQGLALVDLFSLLCMVVFAIALMDGVGPILWSRPWLIGGLLLLSYALALLALLGGMVIGGRAGLSRRMAASIGYCFANRNMALLIACLPPVAATGESKATVDMLWLWFAVVQFPIYTLPMLLTRPLQAWLAREGQNAGGNSGHDQPEGNQ